MMFLSKLKPIPIEMTPKTKNDLLSTLKITFDGGQSQTYKRETEVYADGTIKDLKETWGLIRLPNVPELLNELINYTLDDRAITTDSVMALGMAIYWIEMRRPKVIRKSAVDFDFLSFI